MLSNMTLKQTQRARKRRSEARAAAREVYGAGELGLQLTQRPNGRLRLQWDVDADPSMALFAVGHVHALVDLVVHELVLALREEGESWADIGELLDITGEAARRRWYELDETYRSAVQEDV